MIAWRTAILGRPNVGKSTLFNRLAGKPLAIVDDRPGVTRDRREARARLGDLDLRLIDTAGYAEDPGDLADRLRGQRRAALEAADLVFFVIDAREGVTALDRDIAGLLRRAGPPVILIANKAESARSEPGLLEAYELGLGEPVAFSAAHGEGLSDLYARVVETLSALTPARGPDPDEAAPPLRITVAGRPNVGKSTLINALIGAERLITGPEAGLTRDAIAVDWLWDGRRVRLHDTAGLRKRGKVADRLERMSAADTLRAIKFAEIVFLLIDAEAGFEKQDLTLADRIEREGRGLVAVLSKWDRIADKPARLSALREAFGHLLPQLRGAPLLPASALTGSGLDQLMPAALHVHANWSAKVKTRDLNDWLQEMVRRHPPPAVNGRRIKPRYMAQTKSRPPTFVLMCSRAAAMPEAYKRYLLGGLREAFDLPGVPLRLTVKAGENPYVEGGRS